jgi:hypothetical protein
MVKNHPKPDPNLPSISPKHTHRYFDKRLGRWKQKDCYCDTGRNHVTPKENSG